MKKEYQKSIAIIIGLIIISLFGIGIVYSYFNKDKITAYDLNKKAEYNPYVKNILQIGLIILVVIMVILGLIIGYNKLYEEDKKKYLKFEGEEDGEYKFRHGDQNFYIKKGDIKDGNHY